MPGSLLLLPDLHRMQRAIRLGNNQAGSSVNFTSQPSLAQRIGPRAELPTTPTTSRRALVTVHHQKQQNKPPQVTAKLPIYSYTTFYPVRQVSYTRTFAHASTALMNMGTSPVIGFDIEWRPNFIKDRPENRVACVQLADQTGVAILQISSMLYLPEALIRILQDVGIMKVGVGISEDIKKLKRDWGVSVENVVDLSGFARELDPYWAEDDRQKAEARKEAQRILAEEREKAGIPPPPPRVFKPKKNSDTSASHDSTQDSQQPKGSVVGLARLTARYLSLELVKNKKISRSNWEQPLNQAQIEYAANDAAVAFDIYQMLQRIQEGEVSLPSGSGAST